MRALSLTITVLTLAAWTQALPQKTAKRKVPCKVPENASECYWTHGRITVGNGTPAYRLWKIGTKRILGIYSGPSVYHGQSSIDNENPELPANIDNRTWAPGVGSPLYGDFEVCPLAPERPGTMRPVCLESAKNLFLDRGE